MRTPAALLLGLLAVWPRLPAALAAPRQALEESDTVPDALASDDECLAPGSEGSGGCATNALQRFVVPSSTSAPTTVVLEPVQSEHAGAPYALSWEARGSSFFGGFEFISKNDNVNHGSTHYVTGAEAQSKGIAQAHGSHAILRAGQADPVNKYKRFTAKIATTRSWTYFLAAMKFSHVPFGCGVWPAFYSLAPGNAWPAGGEVDILEYVNDEPSKTSLHTAEPCRLKPGEVNRYGAMPDRNEMNYECRTAYPDQLGCAPNKWMRTGRGWANNPGVLAMERTKTFMKIYFIPEGAIPGDLVAGKPRPETWDRFIVSYYPLMASGCSSHVMAAQRLVLSIGFCGDWASKVWGNSPSCRFFAKNCRSVDPLRENNPEQDCCTQFIYDADRRHGTQEYLDRQAFFNISWLKVFEPGR